MAKVSGPLMSMDASGKFGGAIVFSKWKGRNVVRQLVTPSNPRSQGQEDARNRTRVTGALQNWVNRCSEVVGGKISLVQHDGIVSDKDLIKAVTPAGYAWNGFLTASVIGAGGLTYDAAQSAWDVLKVANGAAWTAAAEGFDIPLAEVYQTIEGGAAGTPLTSGNVFFIYCYTMSLLTSMATPSAVPPVYNVEA